MKNRTTVFKLILACILAAALGVSLFGSSSAEDEDYKYKLPCFPADTCYVTSVAGPSHPGAFDFDPQGSAGLGLILNVSEGIFGGYSGSGACSESGGFGKFATVTDVFGRTLTYAHLSQFGSLVEGERVFQGDIIGVEGDTGHTHSFPPPDYVHVACAAHLHLAGIGSVGKMDGFSLLEGPSYQSTNSWVSGVSQPAQAIRNVYIFLGALLNPDNSWEALGWTADLDPPHVGCGSFIMCQFFIHYVPNPQLGRWGSIMDFKTHPLFLIYDNTLKGASENAIMAGRWDVNSAYWVQLPFYYAWEQGTKGMTTVPDGTDIGLPLMNQLDSSVNATLCPPSLDCTGYQRFSHGYIWQEQNEGVQPAVFCPDVAGSPSGTPWPDHEVDLPNDILSVIQGFGMNDAGIAPFEPWDNARLDLNGDGVIDLPNDILGVILFYGVDCFPGPP